MEDNLKGKTNIKEDRTKVIVKRGTLPYTSFAVINYFFGTIKYDCTMYTPRDRTNMS